MSVVPLFPSLCSDVRRLRRLLPLILTLGLLSCGAATSVADPAPCGLNGTPVHRVPSAVARAIHSLQVAYNRNDLSSVHAEVVNSTIASNLIRQMQTWKSEKTGTVNVSVLYTEKLHAGRYVVTVRFASDPRAPPVIALYVLGPQGGRLRVVGNILGICGATFTRADWAVTRTQHFIVYHSPYVLVGSDRVYLGYLEHQRALFVQRFRVHPPSLAALYLYPSQTLMRKLTGGGCGKTYGEIGCTGPFGQPPTIHTTIQALFHEPIHVYERALEPAPVPGKYVYIAPLFIGEGTAVALEDRQLDPRLSDYCSTLDYAPLDDCAREAVHDVNPMSVLTDKGFKHANPGDAYALGGSFVKFLILKHGYYRFGRFYYVLAAQPETRVQDYDVAARQVYGKSISALVTGWRSSLCPHGC